MNSPKRYTPHAAECDWSRSTGMTPRSELMQVLYAIDFAYWAERWRWDYSEAQSFIVSIVTGPLDNPCRLRTR